MSLLDTASLIITPNGYKVGKLHALKPFDGSGDMTVTRATTATRVNSSGLIESVASNVPRLDYSNGSCPSILVEPQRTNIILYGQDFSSNWNKTNVTTTPNSGTSPLGTTTATKYTCTGNGAYIFQTVASQNAFTISCFFKKSNANWVFLGYNVGGVGDFGVSFNINTGVIGTTLGTGVTSSIKNYGNGWYRCEVTKDFAGAIPLCVVAPLSGDNDFSNQNGKEYLFWGYQGEAGSYATSYIPTTSASVTRNADVISKTGISSLIGQTEGTMFCEFYRKDLNSPFFYIIANSVGINNYLNSIFVYQLANGNITSQSYVAGSQQFNFSASGLSVGKHKIAIAYKQNDFVLYIDGVQIATDTSGNVPPLSAFEINGADTGSISNADINLSALWKTRLTNTQLAQLTTI